MKSKDELLICHLNINSLKNKIFYLTNFLNDNDIDILALSETKICNAFLPTIDGYNMFHKDRTNKGGGVAIYVKNVLKATEINLDTSIQGIELLTINVQLNFNKSFLITSLYRPKFFLTQDEIDCFENLLANHSKKKHDFIILGDFNIHFESKDKKITKFRNMLERNNVFVMIKEPTRFNACIDNILTTYSDSIVQSGILYPNLSDHDA